MSRDGHLDSREIARYLDDELDAEERARLEEHLAGCPDCRAALREAWGARSWWRRRRWSHVAIPVGVAAAAALLFVALPFEEAGDSSVPSGGSPAPSSVERAPGPAGGGVARFPVRRPAEGATVSDASEGVVLVWAPLPGEVTYEVTLTGEDGTPMWTATTRDTVTRVPADVGLEPGGLYLWYVDALLADGRSATTGTRSFEVAP